MSFVNPKNQQSLFSSFPYWVIKKEGNPILFDADFQSTIGFKWGTFKDGAGTVVPDSNHYFGGSRSVLMTTDIFNNFSSELKINLQYLLGAGKIAFEQKWSPRTIAFGGTNFDMGIEPRENNSNGFWQGRMRYTISTDEWQYESGVDSYSAFAEPLIIEQPSSDSAAGNAGDRWGWARLVIDTIKKEYVSFEAAGKTGIEFRDMRGISLVNRGAATVNNLLVFTLVRTAGNGAESMLTTDWCISKVSR